MKLEVLEKECYYHIYNRGINGCKIFENDENKNFFLRQLSKYVLDNVAIVAYCLMDNHFHLVVQVKAEQKLVTQSFSNFFNSYAKAFNKQFNRTGSLFEKHFKRIKLNDEIYLRQLIIYVHLNPTHHLEVDFQTFKFSSYQAMLSNKETKVEKEEVLLLFGGKENFIFSHNERNDYLSEKYALE